MRERLRATSWLGGLTIAVATSAMSAGAASDLRLIDALKRQDPSAVATLLQQRVDVNEQAPDGSVALHWAVHWDDHATVERLLLAGANPNAANELGVTPLALACENGNGPMVATLLNAGANPSASFPTRPPALLLCARTGSTEAVKALLARGAEVNAREPRQGQTALMWAVSQRHPAIVRVLLAAGADVGARSRMSRLMVNRADPNDIYSGSIGEVNVGGSTALLFAARNGDVDSARFLLDAGANADDLLPDGASALVVGAHSDQAAVVSLLLARGANPNAIGAGYTALHAAVLRGNLSTVNDLLSHGALVNSRVQHGTTTTRATREYYLPETLTGATPFLLAARFVEVEIMRALAANGADVGQALPDGTTPLMAAAGLPAPLSPLVDRRGRPVLRPVADEAAALQAVTMLVEAGVDVNATTRRGDTALHGAAARNYPTVARLLVARGAKLDVKDGKGQSPLAVASGDAVRTLLQQLGARP